MARGMPATLSTITLAADVVESASHLALSYRLSNASREIIYVWDEMIGYDDQGEKIDADSAYVCWEKPDTARIARAVLPLPTDFDVYKKEIPYVHKLAPGSALQGKVTLALPLQENNPYYSPAEEIRETDCKKIRLQIGWIEELKGMQVLPQKVRDRPVLALRGSWDGPVQRLAEKTLLHAVKLLVRQDDFDRRLPQG